MDDQTLFTIIGELYVKARLAQARNEMLSATVQGVQDALAKAKEKKADGEAAQDQK